jgi:hypothetical protein
MPRSAILHSVRCRTSWTRGGGERKWKVVDPIATRETYRDLLVYAIAITGSEASLAVRLNVTVAELRNWLEGIADIPMGIFLGTVDVVVQATPEEISRSRAVLVTRTKL